MKDVRWEHAGLTSSSRIESWQAVINLEDVHLAQALNYLEAYNLEIGLLINFGARSLEFKRLYNKKFKPDKPPYKKIP